MKLFDRIVEKLQRMSQTNGADVKSVNADVLNQNIAFAISYAANMQGVSFLQEETDIIREVIERAVARKMGSKKAKETKKTKLEQKPESDDCRYNRYFTQFQSYLNKHYVLRFNVITNQTEIAKIKEGTTELEFKPANDRVRGTICQNVQRKGIGFWGMDVDRYINSEEVEEIFRKTFREVDRSVKGRMYLTADEVFLEMKKAHPTEMCGVNMENFNRVLPTFARRLHTHDGSRYCVVKVE